MVTIAVVALIVFGPKRLPEIARKAGSVLRELRGAAQELKAGIEAEYEETLGPLDEARREIRSALDEADPRREIRPAHDSSADPETPPDGETPGGPQ
jgi:sec-independent protein translocase protein TatB